MMRYSREGKRNSSKTNRNIRSVSKAKMIKKRNAISAKKRECNKLIDDIRYELGKVIESVQYIEYNLGNVYQLNIVVNSINKYISEGKKITPEIMKEITSKASQLKDRLNNSTFGQLVVTIASANIFDEKELNELEDILSTRNKLVHQFFKVNNFEEQSNNPTFLNDQKNYLIKFDNRINNFNDMLYKMVVDTNEKVLKITY